MWLRLGYQNTGFFHAVSKNRRKANSFSVIEDEEGKTVYTEHEIGRVIAKYFNKLYTSKGSRNRDDIIAQALHPIITTEENEALIKPPSPQEIRESVFSIRADKAPGPDGFSASFFQSNWEAIGAEIIAEIQTCFETELLPQKINETHLRLIHKILSPPIC